VQDLIWPVFIHEGPEDRVAVPSMPGVERLSLNLLIDAVGPVARAGGSNDPADQRSRA
jgi:porphobilinogen synthase